MYKIFVLFPTNDTNWCGSLDDVLILILLKKIRIQDGECCGNAIKTTCHTPCRKRQFVRILKEQVQIIVDNDNDDSLFMTIH
jgi:hypothetical protein